MSDLLNKTVGSIFAISIAFLHVVSYVHGQSSSVLRVMSYNIHHGEGSDGKVDLERQAAVIRQVDPDIVFLQEVDEKTKRTGGIDQTSVLGELTKMHGRFAHQLDYEGGRYGQAILSKKLLPELQVHWLPGMPDRERRIAGAISLEWNDHPLVIVTTHLHNNQNELRLQQAQHLVEIFRKTPEYRDRLIVLGGDMNAVPSSNPIQVLSQSFGNAASSNNESPTFPVSKPERQLDYLFFAPSGRFRVRSWKVIDERIASDHLPVVAELEIIPKTP